MNFAKKLAHRLSLLEDSRNDNYRNPHSFGYTRQAAENALFHTIGPLTDSPRWLDNWSSPEPPPPDFVPGGPAPRWTPDELVYAFAGDPELIFSSPDNPRSPSSGRQGGAPLFRIAKRVAKHYGRENDKQFISDMYSNGFVPLVRLMQPGYDEQRSPFISYVVRQVQSAMEHGVGGTKQGIQAQGSSDLEGGVTGLQGLLNTTDPAEAEKLAEQVKGDYQTKKSHDKHEHNPFGPYSQRYYEVAMNYAKALRSKEPAAIDAAKNKIKELSQQIDDDSISVLGASTGMGQAISTQDRKSSIGMQSIDKLNSDDGSMAGNLMDKTPDEPTADDEAVQFILDIALNRDISQMMRGLPRFQRMALDFGAKPGKDGSPDVGGKLTATEYRYLLRQLGSAAGNYPGYRKVRSNLAVPRDSQGWWKAGEDPEIEPIPNSDGIWRSKWLRNDKPAMGPTEIAQEMTEEVKEFNKLGIPTARQIKTKSNPKTGKMYEEAVSKVAVSNTFQSALLKLKLIAAMYRSDLGMATESKGNGLKPFFEDLDKADLTLLSYTADAIVTLVERATAKACILEFRERIGPLVDYRNRKYRR